MPVSSFCPQTQACLSPTLGFGFCRTHLLGEQLCLTSLGSCARDPSSTSPISLWSGGGPPQWLNVDLLHLTCLATQPRYGLHVW